MTIWHLYFDYEPELIGHVCDMHKDGIDCSDMDEQGNCPHVQTTRCTCVWFAECSTCLDEREGVPA